jgi:3'(2'),5'-bisphosphate nucleotidase
MTDPDALIADPRLALMLRLALAAGKAVMAVYGEAFTPTLKGDATPVTAADTAAEAIILEGLAAGDPSVPVISEEASAGGTIPAPARRFYLVDPLDGTREFISRNGEFTVNIALIEESRPAAGVVVAPALDRAYCGLAGAGAVLRAGEGAWKAIAVSEAQRPLRVVASRSHRDAETEAFLARLGEARIVSAGSSLKFCLVAAGEADLYPRFGRTMEWDTAAGQAVLEAAGGSVATLDGRPLAYGKAGRGFDNPAFIAASPSARAIVNRLPTTPR